MALKVKKQIIVNLAYYTLVFYHLVKGYAGMDPLKVWPFFSLCSCTNLCKDYEFWPDTLTDGKLKYVFSNQLLTIFPLFNNNIDINFF